MKNLLLVLLLSLASFKLLAENSFLPNSDEMNKKIPDSVHKIRILMDGNCMEVSAGVEGKRFSGVITFYDQHDSYLGQTDEIETVLLVKGATIGFMANCFDSTLEITNFEGQKYQDLLGVYEGKRVGISVGWGLSFDYGLKNTSKMMLETKGGLVTGGVFSFFPKVEYYIYLAN